MVEQTGTHIIHSGGPWCCAHCPHTLGSPHFAKITRDAWAGLFIPWWCHGSLTHTRRKKSHEGNLWTYVSRGPKELLKYKPPKEEFYQKLPRTTPG